MFTDEDLRAKIKERILYEVVRQEMEKTIEQIKKRKPEIVQHVLNSMGVHISLDPNCREFIVKVSEREVAINKYLCI